MLYVRLLIKKIMNILITGASGFLGREVLKGLGTLNDVKIDTIGRFDKSDIVCDLSFQKPTINNTYSKVIHIAGKAHSVPKTDEEKEEFYKVNHIGTKNLLDSLKGNLPKTFVFISTVAVYGKDYGEMIDESYSLEGNTPYAKSKILAEEEVVNFCKEYKINYVILRLPLISGENAPGNLGSMIKAIKKGYYFRIGKGLAKKSIVSSTDIANLICSLNQNKSGVFNLTDGIDPTFCDIENHIANLYDKKIISLPKALFISLAKIGDVIPFFIINTNKLNKITKSLTFSSEKAVRELNWKPKPALKNIIS